MYDYLIVGAGLYGAVCARELTDRGKRCLVIDRRSHIAGNTYTEQVSGIHVHKYGAHIFHTKDEEVWQYVNRFATFNHYINSPVAVYGDELYNLPFNMNTFSKMWGIRTPAEAKAKIAQQVAELGITQPQNLEEQALSLVGRDVYTKLVKSYTEKQWGRDCRELPAFIIKRLPCRFTYDNNYFNDPHQGIPTEGYTAMAANLLAGVEVRLGVDFHRLIRSEPQIARRIIYTGCIDEYFGYRLGALRYRSLRFETQELPEENHQGNAVVNYTGPEVPYTRVIEHKHFAFGTQPTTVITREYPCEWQPGQEPYYPINDEENNALYAAYRQLAEAEGNVHFGGRLGQYRYYDMDQVIRTALDDVQTL
ncbi:MAG: UDP-galactopyranose mutase [Clostridiales bacterium]|nr:UDP-galactopyranose mutase [Clostridiales bacterium]